MIAEITGIRPPMKTPRWTGKPFPVQYTLPTIEGEKKTVALAPTLQAMGPRKLLCVCLLASYRSNGPYYDLLNRYHNYATHFAPFLEGMHVVTTEPNRYPNRAYHYEREDEMRALSLPFEVMLEEGDVVGTLEPTGSPFVLLRRPPGHDPLRGRARECRVVGHARRGGGVRAPRTPRRPRRSPAHRAAPGRRSRSPRARTS